MRMLRRGLWTILLILTGFYGPWLWQLARSDIRTTDTATPVGAVLVFGALVRGGTISPLHAQRLDTAISLHRADKAAVIVVSNAPAAARIMRDYLMAQGLPAGVIEVDGTAEHTPDTCRSELRRNTPRSLGFVSQSFHLPRLAYQCRQLGLKGQLITATGPSDAPLWTKLRVRLARYTREAFLLWARSCGSIRNSVVS